MNFQRRFLHLLADGVEYSLYHDIQDIFIFFGLWDQRKWNLQILDEYAETATVFKSFKNMFVHFPRPY